MAAAPQQMTTLTLELRREASKKLAQRAAASGQDLPKFVSQLVEHFAEPPTPIEKTKPAD